MVAVLDVSHQLSLLPLDPFQTQSGWYIHENIVFPRHVEPSLCHVSEWADVALPLQVQVCRCSLDGFNARRGACGWSHRFSVVSNQIWVAHVDDVDYNVLERICVAGPWISGACGSILYIFEKFSISHCYCRSAAPFGVTDCKLSFVVNEVAADRQVAFRSRLRVLQCFRPFSDPVSVDVAAMC